MSMSSIIRRYDVVVGGELDRRRRLAAVGRAASGGEAEHVGAAGDLAGRRHGIVARRVHEDEALGGDRLGVFVDFVQRRRAALRRRAQRFFEDGRQPAGLVAGRGIVVHFAAVARAIVLPPTDALDQLVADLRRRGAPGQQMLGAIDLRRLGKNRRAAVAHQDVDRGAERRIGGDAGIAVRTAALQRQRQFARRRRRPLGAVEGGQHGADVLDASRDRLARAAGRLDRQAVERVAFDDAVFLLHAADLEHFAAEPDHQSRANVGIAGIAPLRAHERVEALALGGHAAAGAVHERDDAVDIRIVGENARALDLVRDQARDRRRAVHRGQDREIVARADLAVGAAKALKGRLAPRRAGCSRGARPRRNDSRARIPSLRNCARAPIRPARSACEAKPMIWPNLRIGAPSSIGTTAILWPFGTRWRALTPPAGSAPAEMSSTAMMTLSEGSRRRARGVVMIVRLSC